ncbi:S-adenosyl-L-methionine-dependent methyltransferase [Xylariaceae sp. FL0255]|nr:S-adenosyl-L-methionine-dependent methyltransferase [Xylariaceae sp. FL0255]
MPEPPVLEACIPTLQHMYARLARMLASTGVFLLTDATHIKHSSRSRYLVIDKGTDASVRFTLFDDFPGTSLTPAYFEKHGRIEPITKDYSPYTFATGQPEKTVWQVLDKDATNLSIFLATMKKTQESLRSTVPYDYSWLAAEHQKDPARPLLVEVGGAGGHTVKDILRKFPQIPRQMAILQDRPEVIEENRAKNDPELADVQLMGVDFHKDQPIKGAAVYILRRCLHDYGDDESVGILQKLIPAMKPDSRLLIIESVLTDITPAFCYSVDLTMMAIGGKERTLEDWYHLVTRSGLRLGNVIAGDGMDLGVIECFVA